MADSYVFQEYPKWLYHKHSIPGPVLPSDHRFSRIVDSPAEQAALGQDWTNDPAALQLEDAPAVASDDVSSGAHEWNVAVDAVGILQFLLTEIRTWLNESSRFSAFYDSTGPELIGGPEHDEQRRRQQQRLAELIEQTTRVLTLVPSEGNAIVAGLGALKTFALEHRFACAHRLLKLAGQPVRVDRIGEVLEAWCRHLMTKALNAAAHGRSHIAIDAPASNLLARTPAQAATARRAERARKVTPELTARDWTATRWATEAGVGPSVALDYLSGKTKTLGERTRSLLAKALGKPRAFLP